MTGPYRFYDWDAIGRLLIRAYDCVVAPPTHLREELGGVARALRENVDVALTLYRNGTWAA